MPIEFNFELSNLQDEQSLTSSISRAEEGSHWMKRAQLAKFKNRHSLWGTFLPSTQ